MKAYLTAALAALATLPAVAVEPDSPLLHGLYVAPMYFYVEPHDERLLDSGQGGTLAFGYRIDESLAIELAGVYSKLDREFGGDSATMTGGNVSALGFFSDYLPGLYLAFGAGYLETDRQGQSGNDYSGVSFEAGLGYLLPLSLGNYDFAIRAEARARHNNGQDGDDADEFDHAGLYDGLLNVGLHLPLGVRKVVPPAEDKVAVVPVLVACVDQMDNDGDGLIDYPQDPGCTSADDGDETDLPVCSDGKDNDGDGVADFPADKGCTAASDTDETDPCKTPEPGEKVSLHGCGTGDVIVLRGVNFDFDRSQLTANARTILDGVAEELLRYADIRLELSGHTDAKGSDAYNQRLSEQRARSVVEYLVEKGVSPDRMTVAGQGESQPVADNETDEGRELNRRVELKVTAGVASGQPSDSEPEAATAS